MDRSIYSALLTLFAERPRPAALSRAELRQRLLDLCGVKIHPRDIQDLIAQLQDDGHRIISEARGYWTLGDAPTEADLEAARHAAATRRAHGNAEIEDANRIEAWICHVVRHQRTARTPRRAVNQVGLSL